MEFTSISITSGHIDSKEGLPIRYDLYTPVGTNSHPLPVVIFVHGFKGFKDWGFWPDACEELSYNGFAVIAINLSRNGIGDNKLELDRLDLFESQTMSGDLDDIGSVIDALQRGEIKDEHDHTQINTDLIGIIGHSRGGSTAIAAGVEYDPVQAVVTWAAVADFRAYWSDQMKEDWEKQGHTFIKNSRTGQLMKLGRKAYDDLNENAARINAMDRVADLHVPTLFIHSREDESIPHTDSEKLYIESGSREKELKLLTHGGHTFGGTHPFEEPDFPEPFNEVVEMTAGWFREYLK